MVEKLFMYLILRVFGTLPTYYSPSKRNAERFQVPTGLLVSAVFIFFLQHPMSQSKSIADFQSCKQLPDLVLYSTHCTYLYICISQYSLYNWFPVTLYVDQSLIYTIHIHCYQPKFLNDRPGNSRPCLSVFENNFFILLFCKNKKTI